MTPTRLFTIGLLIISVLIGCVDPVGSDFKASVNVLLVDAALTDLPEPQLIRLNRSQADPFSGNFGQTPIEQARVTVLVDGKEEVTAREIKSGVYQLPNGFQGKVGSLYKLRLTLAEGGRYESTEEILHAAPPIQKITDQYNPRSLPPGQIAGLKAANDLFIETTDPAGVPNYYRWDWVLWERQEFCQTCGRDFVYYERDDAGKLVEGCLPNRTVPLPFPRPQFIDYEYRTSCWEILFSAQLNVFADTYTDGRTIAGRRIAQIPFYQYFPALVEVRQSAFSLAAYTYFKRLDEQTQRTGGLTDTPPAAPVGNIRSLDNTKENVVGYFTASGVSSLRYWLTRKNVTSELPAEPGSMDFPKLFTYLNTRPAYKEPVAGLRGRPPLAVCVPSDTRTPVKPEGWQQ